MSWRTLSGSGRRVDSPWWADMRREAEVEKAEVKFIDFRNAGTTSVEGRADGMIRERNGTWLEPKSLRGLETIVVRVAAASISTLLNSVLKFATELAKLLWMLRTFLSRAFQ